MRHAVVLTCPGDHRLRRASTVPPSNVLRRAFPLADSCCGNKAVFAAAGVFVFAAVVPQ